MVVVPAPTAVTFPLLFTVATDGSELVQVTFLSSVVSSGNIVAVSVWLAPFSKVKELLLRRMPLIGTFTVILQVAFTPLPFCAAHVIVAVPPPTAFTTPVDDMVATAELDVVHITFLLVASAGVIVAFNAIVSPLFMDALVLSNVISVTSTALLVYALIRQLFPYFVPTSSQVVPLYPIKLCPLVT